MLEREGNLKIRRNLQFSPVISIDPCCVVCPTLLYPIDSYIFQNVF